MRQGPGFERKTRKLQGGLTGRHWKTTQVKMKTKWKVKPDPFQRKAVFAPACSDSGFRYMTNGGWRR